MSLSVSVIANALRLRNAIVASDAAAGVTGSSLAAGR